MVLWCEVPDVVHAVARLGLVLYTDDMRVLMRRPSSLGGFVALFDSSYLGSGVIVGGHRHRGLETTLQAQKTGQKSNKLYQIYI